MAAPGEGVSELARFLAGVPVLASLTAEQVAQLAAGAARREYRAGDLILQAGDSNRSLYFVETGRLAVQVRRGESTDTVAHLHPGAPFGELSLVTGRPCAADVRAAVDASVIVITGALLDGVPEARRSIVERLATTLAERLHSSLAPSPETPQAQVVLLHLHPRWRAPRAFARELARSLASQTGWRTLCVDLGGTVSAPAALESGVWVARVAAPSGLEAMRSDLALHLHAWQEHFDCVVLNPSRDAVPHVPALRPLATWYGRLLGPSDEDGRDVHANEFVVQDADAPTLPRLSGRAQLIGDVAAAEHASTSQRPVSPKFQRTVDSIARCIAQLQVGVALGGGGAWAWAHVGALRALARAGVPVDVLTGCSMGSFVGALIATGRDLAYVEQTAEQWRRRFPRIIEYRFWRMHLARVSGLTNALRERFGHRLVNQTDIPFWANALDVEAAHEVALADGDLVAALMASMALPLWLPPWPRDGRVLIDAALVNPVPAALARAMHCHFTLAINVIGPFKARALDRRFPFGAYDFVSRCLRIVGHQMGQARIEACADAILLPDLPAETSMLSFDRWPDIVAAGEREAEARMPAVLSAYGRLRDAVTRRGAAIAARQQPAARA
jgi:NTE family protein